MLSSHLHSTLEASATILKCPNISGGSTGPFLGDGFPVCVCAALNLMSLRSYAVTYASSPCLHDVKSFSCLVSGDRGPLGTCPVCVVLNPMQGENTWKTTREALSIQPTKVKVAQVSMGDDRNNLCSNPRVHQARCWTCSISDLLGRGCANGAITDEESGYREVHNLDKVHTRDEGRFQTHLFQFPLSSSMYRQVLPKPHYILSLRRDGSGLSQRRKVSQKTSTIRITSPE